ncbi:MAG: type VI secretion system baseplate subunit TssF [Gemmataceae bacterium]|nr:type VI secretion system baseplate subunit TssF [Gemmataceae bacterium]
MPQPIEDFLERELLFLEQIARPFAEHYPANAKHLVPEPGAHADPHLERMIEGFTLLSGRIRHKLDSDFPKLTGSMLQILYPHLSLIIPSMSIARVSKVPSDIDLRQGWRLEKGTPLRSQVFGKHAESLQYSLGYPVTVWPIELTNVTWEANALDLGIRPPKGTTAVVRLLFSCKDGLRFEDLALEKVRLYLTGERQLMAALYEIIFNRCLGVAFQPVGRGGKAGGSSRSLRFSAKESLFQVGLDLDEGLLPFPPEAFLGYRQLMELLSFPLKYQFIDLAGWQHLRDQQFGSQIEVHLFLSQTQENLERSLSTANILLNCAPVVNLFRQSCDPIDKNNLQPDYRVVPSRRQPRGMEIYSIESVRTLDAESGRVRDVVPFYASEFAAKDERPAYYHAVRRESLVEQDLGTEVYVAIVDPEFHPSRPENSILDVRAWCTNRDLSFEYQHAGDPLVVSAGPGGTRGEFTLLYKPTYPLRAFLGRNAYWRLLGQNCLNRVSLVDEKVSLKALQELLSLCDFSGPATQLAAVNHHIIEGIKAVSAQPIMHLVKSSAAKAGICRGMEVHLEFDEEKYTGTGVFLVASVLERFFALYTGVNSFTKMVARTSQSEGDFKSWPPRAGADQLP